MALLVPTIHMNGTSRDVLIDQAVDGLNALDAALVVLRATGPNGRDFYPQGPEAIVAAMAAHRELIERVQSAYDDLKTMAEAIA